MKIYKTFNNNVVQTYDDEFRELIVIGNGIAYNKQIGSNIDESRIDKRFVLQNSQQMEMMMKLLDEIPISNFEVSEKIITFAENYLSSKLNDSIHITRADHISFAINRLEGGYEIKNPLLNDIRFYYENEYVIGLYGLQLIKEELGVVLPEDEAGNIVMHIIDATISQNEVQISKVMEIVNQLIKIVKYQLYMPVDENNLSYQRLVTHLKYFAQRIIRNEHLNTDPNLSNLKIVDNYPEAYRGAIKIAKFIEKKFEYYVIEDELVYLTIHLQRLIKSTL